MKIISPEGNLKTSVIANAALTISGSIPAVGPNSVLSGNIASGQVSRFHLSSGTISSGHIASGAIFTWGGSFSAVFRGTIGPNDIGSGAITSGMISSGNLGSYHFTSGAIITAAQNISPIISGGVLSFITEERVSGGRAVQVSPSGNLRIAMAGVSGRMPAIGVVVDNVLSGIQTNVYTHGFIAWNSGGGVNNGHRYASGHVGRTLIVGNSGEVVPFSGSYNSGGLVGTTALAQRLGVVQSTMKFVLNVSPICWSGVAQWNNII